MISFLRPVIFKEALVVELAQSPVRYQPSSVKVSAVLARCASSREDGLALQQDLAVAAS